MKLTRRHLLRNAVAMAGMCALVPASVHAAIPAPLATRTRSLWIKNVNTGEAGTATYVRDGYWDEEGCLRLDWCFRDWRAGTMHPVDRRLYDALYILQTQFESENPLVLVSGYRSQQTNAALAERSQGVSTHSYHLTAKAVDFRIPGRSLDDIYAFLARWSFGGVGLYDSWIHADVGNPGRRWRG